MDVPDYSSDPLAQPTRAKIFSLLKEKHGPMSTAELAAALGMHGNGIRLHLERLEHAGLIARRREQGARGRPRDRWSIAADARPAGVKPSAYTELARWLVRSLDGDAGAMERVDSVGYEIGQNLVPGESGDLIGDAMFDALASLGFQPSIESENVEAEETSFCLNNCPYRDAVHENQPLVCGLHRGMTRGLVEKLDPGATLVDFVAKDPDVAGCEVVVAKSAA